MSTTLTSATFTFMDSVHGEMVVIFQIQPHQRTLHPEGKQIYHVSLLLNGEPPRIGMPYIKTTTNKNQTHALELAKQLLKLRDNKEQGGHQI